jgi:hypothetical protein
LALAVALIAALACAGCGGASKQTTDYVKQVNDAQQGFVNALSALPRGPAPLTVAQQRTAMAKFERALAQIVASLRAIAPPRKVASLHWQLIDLLLGYAAEVKRDGDGLALRGASKRDAARQRLRNATLNVSTRADQTIAALNTKLH